MKEVSVIVLAAMVLLICESSRAQTVDDFRVMFEQYAMTHGEEQVTVYAQTMISGMTVEAEQLPIPLHGVLLGDGVVWGDRALLVNGVLLSDNRIFDLENGVGTNLVPQLYHLRDLWSACRHTFVRDLLASAAMASERSIACHTIDSPPGFLACTSEALAAHATSIAGAQQRRIACYENALADCRSP